MKKIICEMCNSADIIKQDGVYVCCTCGMKYSLEDARSMMVEIPDAGGTATGNTYISASIENGRIARAKEDWASAENYYCLAEQEEPSNIEAIFYRAYSKARQTLGSDDLYMRQESFKKLVNCIQAVGTACDSAESEGIVRQINGDIHNIASDSYLYNISRDGYGEVVGDDKKETENLFLMLFLAMNDAINAMIARCEMKYLYELLQLNYRRLLLEPLNSLLTDNYRDSIRNESEAIAAKIASMTEIKTIPSRIDLSDPKNVVFGSWQGVPLEWSVACYYGDMVCLFCNSCIAKMMVDKNLNAFSMTGTMLYNWLISDFVNNAFFGEDRLRVMPPLIKYPTATNVPLSPNVAVFIPTIAELKTFDFTPAAKLMGTRNRAWWWTASTRRHRGRTIFVDVNPDGEISTGHYPNDTRISVRPMVWVYTGEDL